MDFLDLVRTRQSCRSYSRAPVPRELVEKCLEAARLAPSACNSQPWKFLVVDTEPLRTTLAGKAFTGIYSMNKFALDAPVIIVPVTQRSKYIARLGGHLRGVQYSLIDIGIAGQHLDLQAAELGLGCCWLGWFNENAVKKVLGLSRTDKVDVIFSVGFPAGAGTREKKRLPLDDVRTFVAAPRIP